MTVKRTLAVLAVAVVAAVDEIVRVMINDGLVVVDRDVAGVAAAEIGALLGLEALRVLAAAAVVELARVEDCAREWNAAGFT